MEDFLGFVGYFIIGYAAGYYSIGPAVINFTKRRKEDEDDQDE